MLVKDKFKVTLFIRVQNFLGLEKFLGFKFFKVKNFQGFEDHFCGLFNNDYDFSKIVKFFCVEFFFLTFKFEL